VNHRTIWILPLLAWSGMAASAPTAKAMNEYREAANRFSSLVAEAEAGEKTSQLRSPEFEKIVAILSDEQAMLVASTDVKQEMEADLEVCGIASKAVASLMMFDLKENIAKIEGQQKLMSDFDAMMNRNVLIFQDELKELQPFLFRCIAKAIPSLDRFLASLEREQLTDVRRGGVVKMREGILMTFDSGLAGANDTTIQEDYRSAMLSVLAETAEAYASVMKLPERKKISDAIGPAALSADERYKPYLILIARAFRSEECSAICEIQ
jgi:hypothetical protein